MIPPEWTRVLKLNQDRVFGMFRFRLPLFNISTVPDPERFFVSQRCDILLYSSPFVHLNFKNVLGADES